MYQQVSSVLQFYCFYLVHFDDVLKWNFISVLQACNKLFIRSGISNVLLYSVWISDEYSFFQPTWLQELDWYWVNFKFFFFCQYFWTSIYNFIIMIKNHGVSQSLRLLCQGSFFLPSICLSFILTLTDFFPVFYNELQIFWKSKVIICWFYWFVFSNKKHKIKWLEVS